MLLKSIAMTLPFKVDIPHCKNKKGNLSLTYLRAALLVILVQMQTRFPVGHLKAKTKTQEKDDNFLRALSYCLRADYDDNDLSSEMQKLIVRIQAEYNRKGEYVLPPRVTRINDKTVESVSHNRNRCRGLSNGDVEIVVILTDTHDHQIEVYYSPTTNLNKVIDVKTSKEYDITATTSESLVFTVSDPKPGKNKFLIKSV